jgi:hypothetical protein
MVHGASPSREPADRVPAPGELGLKEKRSWKTWQLVVAMSGALLVGFALNYSSAGGASSGKSTSGSAYTLPPAGGSSTATTAPASQGGTPTTAGSAKGGSSTTTTAGSSTTTTTSGSSTSTSSSTTTTTATARVLVGPMQSTGNWTSPAFTITTASWNIGWAFQCTPAPASGTSFEVFVTPAGKSPTSAAAITETGAAGQAVTAETSVGQQTLVLQAPATCSWAVKVTGS